MEKKELIKRLRELLKTSSIVEDADMSGYTSFRAGGKAMALVEVENKEQLKADLQMRKTFPTYFWATAPTPCLPTAATTGW